MAMSISPAWGLSWMVLSKASSPSPASPTTSMSSYMFRRACSPSLSTAWSSAIRTRILRIATILLSHGNPDLDSSAAAGRRDDLQSSSQQGRTLLHPQDAPARARGRRLPNASHVEAHTVVLHLPGDAAALE